MTVRNEASDAGRKGTGVGPQTKQSLGALYVMPQPRGRWLPAYGGGSGWSNGGMGKNAFDYDPQQGNAGDEVGNDYDNDYDSNKPYTPQG